MDREENGAQDAKEASSGAGSVGEAGLLQLKIDDLEAKVKENWDLYLRSRADLENARRRAAIDLENAHKYALESFIKDLLVVLDSMEQGIAHAKDDSPVQSIKDGMGLTLKQMREVLKKFAIEEISPGVGESIDPNCHEVISMQDSQDVGHNSVMAVVQKGFKLQNRILRPARVVVARNEQQAT